ncbi:MAG: ribonuclease HII [Amphiamblys sp. WSBS2006]|nr:MAG: ribonuclease HII [Amphiamblys sp. WSBS2006]
MGNEIVREKWTTDTLSRYVVGVDESGRGPVFGPLVYCGFFCDEGKYNEVLREMGVKDSKKVSESKRKEIHTKLLDEPGVGWVVSCFSSRELSEAMFHHEKENVNLLSYKIVGSIITKIWRRLNKPPSKVYLDIVGLEETYRKNITPYTGEAEVVIESDADSTYLPVSASSIIAKLVFDEELQRLGDIYGGYTGRDRDEYQGGAGEREGDDQYGSGVLSDERTKKWLDTHYDALFGYPCEFVRLSWEPIVTLMKKNCFEVQWFSDSTYRYSEEYFEKEKEQKEKNRLKNKKNSERRKVKRAEEREIKEKEKPVSQFIIPPRQK